ncbi:GGDEF domain-containing protein [Gayadomonas joobiniege]|uniref:GGDEF domain-containing protein n=1 Tax=Gayadomonas joobiniege TaxID=1234606 RepID=UPI00037A2826|nr:GGDEF domain-containing protein [Gayadomonas joobiniege]
MSEQAIEALKKKLFVSVQARQNLEKTYQNQFNLLSRFIIRLSHLCTGIDTELDNRLARLRALLVDNSDLEKILPLIKEIENLLNQQSARLNQNLKNTQDTLLNASKQLQQARNLPAELRRDLRSFIQELSDASPSVRYFVPALERLVALYSVALADNTKIKDGATPMQNNGDTCALVCQELETILSHLDLPEKTSQKIKSIQQDLISQNDSQSLVTSCIEVIRIIVEGIGEERTSAEKFLFNLNDALSTVHTAISCSLENHQRTSNEREQLNKKMHNNLDQMNADITSAQSLSNLKSQINARINELVNVLNEKEILERLEHKFLADQLISLDSRIEELEKESQVFQQRLAEQKYKSLQDALTQLPNRASLDARLDLEYKRWVRYSHHLCIAMLDIDHFKQVNDQYGHSIGDKVLTVIAKTLAKLLRDTDFVARYGGEEFVLIFPESQIAEIERRLNHIRVKISQIPFKIKNEQLTVTVSAGITQFKAVDDVKTAFDRADAALYQAKKQGRNQVIAKT